MVYQSVFFLLIAANMTDDHERLVRATAELTYDDMKEKVQKSFGEYDGKEETELQESKLLVRVECLYRSGKQMNAYSRNNRFFRGAEGFSYRGANRGGSFVRGSGRPTNNRNPIYIQGQVM